MCSERLCAKCSTEPLTMIVHFHFAFLLRHSRRHGCRSDHRCPQFRRSTDGHHWSGRRQNVSIRGQLWSWLFSLFGRGLCGYFRIRSYQNVGAMSEGDAAGSSCSGSREVLGKLFPS
ncbi:hypothetical protein EG68_10406 [Paragonimus skrjabini miyazakii]|uniref:Uncharacterized protein n=1 Tax=Paragonimus skrjabini miyazakii TaxID=59628 RepID=A0A8S9YSA7_9TREM|nr:hypothetical protein EG68_10406 [Paragonimus skrjabini miyazakii]